MQASVSPCDDPVEPLAVLVQPGERPDRPGSEQEAIGVPKSTPQELPGEHGGDHDPREVVVGERGVADVGRDEHLSLTLTLDLALGEGEVSGLETRVDDDLVLTRLEIEQLSVGEAETPGALVIGGAIGDQVGLVGQRMQVLTQLLERQPRPHGLAVGDDVERTNGGNRRPWCRPWPRCRRP